jgi:hypothetical protein
MCCVRSMHHGHQVCMQAENRLYICVLWLCRKLNKLGTFSLSQLGKSKSPIAEFMRNARKNNDNFEESLLKLVCPSVAFSRKSALGFSAVH